ncbi:M28 family peptidase [Motilimonas pumila]|uniref:M28 family peptidase n=1 Tax=Motilimonas pumila TaxID=2303987 RepID=A0A418YIQ0_9GAMM|nr:M28 family peptidase [Motilimonas pumila]RJG50497.1 M28 family peptidase [Motilimonas pumila]
MLFTKKYHWPITITLIGSSFLLGCESTRFEVYKDENIQQEESKEVLQALASAANEFPDVNIDIDYLKAVVNQLTIEIGPRDLQYYQGLQQAKSYVSDEFRQLGYRPELQQYKVEGKTVANVIASIGPMDAPRIIIGAHYDAYGSQPGADDNASGVAGMLEIAKLLKPYEKRLRKRVDFVAYTLEEHMPINRKEMGSYIHAKSLRQANTIVEAMVSLEMIGYFSDQPNSQQYPYEDMKQVYPTTANFVVVVSDVANSPIRGRFKTFMSEADIRVRSLAAPSFVDGIDRSDHASFWRFNYPGIMVTDTSFYRNPNYHKVGDNAASLDYERMAQVVRGAFYGTLNFAL